MHQINLILVLIVGVLTNSFFGSIYCLQNDGQPSTSNAKISLKTDKQAYNPGQEVIIDIPVS